MKRRYLCVIITILVIVSCSSNSYDRQIREFQSRLKNQRHEAAVTEIKTLIERYPDKPAPYYHLGILQYRLRNYYECLSAFENAESRGFQGTYEYYAQKGIAMYNVGEFARAANALKRSVGMRSTPDAHRYLGMILYDGKLYDAAAVSLREAVKKYPGDAQLLAAHGTSLAMSGQASEAADVLKRAAALSPGDTGLAFRAANVLRDQGRANEAVAIFDSVGPDSPYRADAAFNAGAVSIELGDYGNAARYLKEYVTSNPDDDAALLNLGAALVKTGDYTAAVDMLSGLHERNADDALTAFNLGLAYLSLGALEQAGRCLASAVRLAPDNTSCLYAYGLALTKQGELDRARKQIEAIIELDPGDENARRWIKNYPAGPQAAEGGNN